MTIEDALKHQNALQDANLYIGNLYRQNQEMLKTLEYVQAVARDAGLQAFGLDTSIIDNAISKTKGV